MNKILLALVTLFFILPSFSQQLTATSPEFPGTPYSGKFDMFRSNDSRSFKKSILYTGGEEVIFTMSSSKKDDESVVKMNASMNILWQTPIKDKVLFISRLKNKILVISTPDWKKSNDKFLKKMNAALLDPSTGKVLAEKSIFENNAHIHIDPDFFADDNNDFQGILIRYTADKKKHWSLKSDIRKRYTNKLDLISIDSELAIQSRTLTSGLSDEAEFMGSAMNKRGEIFLVGCSDNLLFAEKYPVNGTISSAKLSTAYDAKVDTYKFGENDYKHGQLNIDESGNLLAVAFSYRNPKYDNSILAVLFNFTEGKTYQQDEQFTKAHKKELKISNLDDLKVSSVQFYGDKIIVCKETQTITLPPTQNSSVRFSSSQIIVSVYDKNLKFLKDLFFGRYYEAFKPDQKFAGYTINDHFLYVLYTDIAGAAKYATILGKIDLDKLEIILNSIVVDRGSVDKGSGIEAAACLWFDKMLILPYIIELRQKKEATIFQKIKLN
ncbi:hypothetical protein [Ferruginibacter sp. SUN106]|uniref:hypothetical protein n=1 Tax=Ferruginibacter sp. SUN106 TaxID=2978348 RepID=UPI003D35EA30